MVVWVLKAKSTIDATKLVVGLAEAATHGEVSTSEYCARLGRANSNYGVTMPHARLLVSV